MRVNKFINKRAIEGITIGVFALGATAVHAHHIFINNGTAAQVGLTKCSPHGASGSAGGSQFYDCHRGSCTQKTGADYYWCSSSDSWPRSFNCAKGTACANALCGSSKALKQGYSESASGSSHGKNGGHTPFVYGYTCY